ncbi:NAD(P)-dependent oxidoreductase [bacterium]|nr:MAG: NAD(P)-dependent oxidoreductase [bacterium]
MESSNGITSLNTTPSDPVRPLVVLLTGPSGRIGPHLVADFETRYDLRTFDLKPSERPNSFVGDLSCVKDLRIAMRDVDVVVHLAATSDEAPFIEELVPNNVVGLYNVFEAARLEKVRRVVFASSVQAMGIALEHATEPVETDVVRPNSLYGATKALGEVLGQWYHDRFELEFIAVRLGWFQEYEEKERNSSEITNIWLSPRDFVSIMRKAVDVPDIGYAVVNGTSSPPRIVMSLQSAYDVLGFEPVDGAEWSTDRLLQTTNH